MESPSKAHLISARGVCRNFETSEGTIEVLKGVDLFLDQGEMAAVVGESGVGKSTLLHILGGLDRPSSGQVTIDEQDLASKSESELADFRNKHLGFVFQHHYLLEEFTAIENVMIPSLIAGKEKRSAARLAEHLLDEVGLSNRLKHRPRQLSGGEQQRVAVARALVNNPRIVIADEPSGNLDIKTGERLHHILGGLNKSLGTAFLLATHNVELARSCHRIVRLEDGRVADTVEN